MPLVELAEDVTPLAITELAAATNALFEGFDDRSFRILSERIFAFEKQATLEELGQTFKLTRERVRQLEVAILKKLQTRLTFPKFACIGNAAKSMANELGLIVPKRRLDELANLVMMSSVTAKCPNLLPLLLWLGGPYALSHDWVIRKPVADTSDRIRACLPEIGVLVGLSEVSERLRLVGVSVTDLSALLATYGYRILGDNVLLWRGSLADKAFAILTSTGRAMTREEISANIPDEHSIRTLGNYLFDDKRFVRVNRTEFALSSTGRDGYKGIVQELIDEIERQGGEATLDHLRHSLMDRFGVSESSIISYLNSPLFARASRGGFRVRRDDEDVTVQSRVEHTRSCFLIEGAWAYRLQVDDELIRGSGRNVPSGFAQGIGIGPGESTTYSSAHGDYRIAWVGPQPTVGSVRRFVEVYDLAPGDWLYLAPKGGQLSTYALRASDLVGLSNLNALFKQTCPALREHSDQRQAVGISIGLSPADSWSNIRRRLLERRESDLYALVPEDDLTTNEDETLANLFEYIGTEGF